MTTTGVTGTLTFQAVRDQRLACGRGQVQVQNVRMRLDAWRAAEHRRDGLAVGSSERQEAEEQVRAAQKAFHAEFAQASARYAEEEFRDPRRGWSARLHQWADAELAAEPRGELLDSEAKAD